MRNSLIVFIVMILTLPSAGCVPRQTYPATPTKTPQPTYTPVTPQPTATQTDTPAPTQTPPITPASTSSHQGPAGTPGTPTPTPIPPTPDPALPPEHYWLSRPIQPGNIDYADRTYAYGATQSHQFRPHTGEEFRNPESTPVVAVGNATVYYAGADTGVVYGPGPNFYGNLIVLQLTDVSYNGKPIYALYGHLSVVLAQTGQPVQAGDVIGEVGSTGVAIGPHLHFEVRVGDPMSYATATRNPDLWIRPYGGYGTLAGRVVDGSGVPLREVALTLHGADMVRYTWTYAGEENVPDEQWRENFAIGDLPRGWYTVTTRSATKSYSFDVYIRGGHTTWIDIVLP